jgi:hypothetical protein
MKIIVSFYGINPSLIPKQNIYRYLNILKEHLVCCLLSIIITPCSLEISINEDVNVFSFSSVSNIGLIVYKLVKNKLKNIYKPHPLRSSYKMKIRHDLVKIKSGFLHKKIEKMNSYGQSILVFKNILSSFVTIILKKKYVYKIISVKVF